MESIDDQLKQDLASGPLTRNGFSDALKKRIGERLDEQSGTTKKWVPWLSGISACLLASAVFLSLDWQRGPGQNSAQVPQERNSMQTSLSSLFSSTASKEVLVHSAVLIGLRTDHPQTIDTPEYSTYRTLLLADDQGELQKIAEGNGILMPYKTEFMKIVSESRGSANGESRVLSASLAADASRLKSQDVKPVQPLKLSEKLLFAGNRYLSVSQTVRQNTQGKETQYEYVWVKELQDIIGSKPLGSFPSVQDPHVSMQELYGNSVQARLKALSARLLLSGGGPNAPQVDENGESWAIVRERGQWVPQLATYTSRASNNAFGYQLQDVPLILPDSVVTYDRLSADWNEIQRIRPDAKDAFSSPNNELVGVVSGSDITVYPFDGKLGKKPLLTLSLAPSESVVMIQWAIDEPFVEMWKEKGKKLLGY